MLEWLGKLENVTSGYQGPQPPLWLVVAVNPLTIGVAFVLLGSW